MTIDIDFLLAECAIRQLQARYSDAVWRLDFAEFGDCFTHDCEWHIDGVVMHGRDEIIAHNRKVFSAHFKRLFITLRTPILEVGKGESRGTASGRTYFSAQNFMADDTSFAPLGVYYERYKNDGDRWRISWRMFQTLYTGPADLSGSLHDQPDFGSPPAMPHQGAISRNITGMNTSLAVGPTQNHLERRDFPEP